MIDQNPDPAVIAVTDQVTSGSLTPDSTASKSPSSYNGQPDDLHDLFGESHGVGADADDPLAALRNDPNYSALIKDLEYIATQARLLFEPAEEAPSDEVWNKIQSKLQSEPEGSA